VRRSFVHFEQEAFVYFRLTRARKSARFKALISKLNVYGEVGGVKRRVGLIRVEILDKGFAMREMNVKMTFTWIHVNLIIINL
jgi:hypothetical protein